jgi:hypothetical protein
LRRTPQAGIAVYGSGQDGLLAAARVYDDIEAPSGQVDAYMVTEQAGTELPR